MKRRKTHKYVAPWRPVMTGEELHRRRLLAAHMDGRSFTAEETARRLGITVNSLYRMERGEIKISSPVAILARIMLRNFEHADVDPGDYIEFDPDT